MESGSGNWVRSVCAPWPAAGEGGTEGSGASKIDHRANTDGTPQALILQRAYAKPSLMAIPENRRAETWRRTQANSRGRACWLIFPLAETGKFMEFRAWQMAIGRILHCHDER